MPKPTPRERLTELWTGRLPLARAFWEHAILYGAAANVAATGAALSALALGWPAPLALAIHLLPVPYVLSTVVGVCRSAGKYAGPAVWARTAEIAVIVWAGLMVLA